MKKLLFGILTFLGIGLSFCSAGSITLPGKNPYEYSLITSNVISNTPTSYKITFNGLIGNDGYDSLKVYGYNCDGSAFNTSYGGSMFVINGNVGTVEFSLYNNRCGIFGFYLQNYGFSSAVVESDSVGGGSSSCEDKDITIYYNSGSSTSITCDGVQAIEIQGLSTITSTNTFTPYYNISYTDEDNQKLTESYSKDILYLSGGLFKKTYTGDNERILTDTIESPNSSFSGYLPTFEITGGIEEVTESGNIFNNFAENSLKFTLSNIPSYIQYVILLMLLFFILGFIRKFRRK